MENSGDNRPDSRSWTVETLQALKGLTDARVSPDGHQVAFVAREAWKDGTRLPRSQIWMVDRGVRQPRPFTAGPRADQAPRWSPDSRTLAFLSDREEDGRLGIHTMSRDGGEARSLGTMLGNVSDLHWSPDGRQIAFLMADTPTDEERRRQHEGDDHLAFEQHPSFQRLWVMQADGTRPRCLTPEPLQVWEFTWFPNSDRLATICSDLPYEWSWYQSYLSVIGMNDGQARLVHQGARQMARPLPDLDGSAVLFIGGIWSDRGLVGGEIFRVPVAGGEPICLTPASPASYSWMEWLDPSTLLLVGYQDGEAALFTLARDGDPRRWWQGEAMFGDRWWARASIPADGALAAVIREDPAAPPDVWTVSLPSSENADAAAAPIWSRLTEMQPELRERWLGDSETLHWQSADGTPVQGILLRPLGARTDERYPLVTVVHGGPTTLYHHGFISSYFWWVPLLVSRGCAVLLPNPRGSTGWGAAFAEANLGDLGGGDLADVLAGIDVAIARGVADADRLAIAGWSYGGFLTAWAITQTSRFRAAVVGAGISHWRSFHGVSNLPTWDRRYQEADPYQVNGRFDRSSPVLHLGGVRTPTLIVHGQDDACVPVGQAFELYRGLREAGVETELVVYPREGHAIQERVHQRDLIDRGVAWLCAHLDPRQG